jgi:hypothetical protein
MTEYQARAIVALRKRGFSYQALDAMVDELWPDVRAKSRDHMEYASDIPGAVGKQLVNDAQQMLRVT